MNASANPRTPDERAASHKRKIGQAVMAMKIAWPLTVVLILYLRYFGEKGTAFGNIVAIVLVVCILVAIGATFQFFESRKEYKALTAQSEDQE
jgi:hypothetical protein